MAGKVVPISAPTFWNTGGLGKGGPKEGTSSRAVTDTCGAKRTLLLQVPQGSPGTAIPLLQGSSTEQVRLSPAQLSRARLSRAQPSKSQPSAWAQVHRPKPRPAAQPPPPQPSSVHSPALGRGLTTCSFVRCFL